MREIKFRVWDRQNKCFKHNPIGTHCYSQFMVDAFTGEIYDAVGTFAYQDDSERTLVKNEYYLDDGKKSKYPQYAIQQYTGLKDSLGVEIYEDDIVTYHYDNPNVYWTNLVGWKDGSWVYFHFDGTESAISFCNAFTSKQLRVIGNKLENPNLLEIH